jgi:hypothetical protein
MIPQPFLQALADDRLQALIGDFRELRASLSIHCEDPVRVALQSLLRTVYEIVYDQNEIRKLEDDDPTVDSSASTTIRPADVLDGIHIAEAIMLGHGFADTVAALCLFRAKLRLTGVASEVDVLSKFDDFLRLIGFEAVSVRDLWDQCSAYTEQQARLWAAVTALLYAVRDHCSHAAVTTTTLPAEVTATATPVQ